MNDIRKRHQETQCLHASLIPDETGTVVTPIYQTSTFSFRDVDHGADLFAGKPEDEDTSFKIFLLLHESFSNLNQGSRA